MGRLKIPTSTSLFFKKKQVKKVTLFSYLLNLPSIFLIFFTVFYPIAYSITMSMFEFNLKRPKHIYFIGLGNYLEIFTEPIFWRSMLITVTFSCITIPLIIILGLVTALILNEEFKGKGIATSLLLIPWAMSPAINGLIWRWIYNPRYGMFTKVLQSFGIEWEIQWLGDPSLALFSVAFAFIWRNMPTAALLYLGGLQSIPIDIHEAAKVDGANTLQRFYRITLPLLKPVTMVLLILITMFSFRVLSEVYVLTAGGPAGATTVIGWLAYTEAFSYLDIGRGCAISYIIAASTIILAYLYIKVLYVEIKY